MFRRGRGRVRCFFLSVIYYQKRRENVQPNIQIPNNQKDSPNPDMEIRNIRSTRVFQIVQMMQVAE